MTFRRCGKWPSGTPLYIRCISSLSPHTLHVVESAKVLCYEINESNGCALLKENACKW